MEQEVEPNIPPALESSNVTEPVGFVLEPLASATSAVSFKDDFEGTGEMLDGRLITLGHSGTGAFPFSVLVFVKFDPQLSSSVPTFLRIFLLSIVPKFEIRFVLVMLPEFVRLMPAFMERIVS